MINDIITDLSYEDFLEIVDNLYDEIWVYDDQYKIVYANQATRRHYALEPKDIIGKTFQELVSEKIWEPSVLPSVYQDKKVHAIRQYSNIGVTLINIATPIFGEDGKLRYVAMSVRDEVRENIMLNSEEQSEEDSCAFRASHEIISASDAMKKVLHIARKVSSVDSTCLITGESGTGKTMLARYIHDHSDRRDKPFVSINCSSIPRDLIESELFGYKGGAFTGARSGGKIGLLKHADSGTVLLDEISEIPYNMQAKLLHAIQEKEFLPVGADTPTKVDIKIIAATNRDLEKLSRSGAFREDLYYRLNVFEIYMPPLRERQKDIEPLILFYMNKYCEKYGMTHEISPAAMDILCSNSWRGNIRELAHVIERLVVITENIRIEPSDLPLSVFSYQSEGEQENLQRITSYGEAIRSYESKIINQAYREYKTTRRIAEALSISQTKAATLVQKYVKRGGEYT